MPERRWHLISYDVREPKRLRKVAKLLEGFGERVQYSVFRCQLDELSLERLRWQLSKVLDKVDSLIVIPLCSRCAGRVPLYSSEGHDDWANVAPSFTII